MTYPSAPESSPLHGDVPLDRPYYGASLPVAVRRFFAKYATFSGRASRSEFWWWTLVSVVIGIIFNVLTTVTGGDPMGSQRMNETPASTVVLILQSVWSLLIIVPGLALAWRRLHDTNRSGARYLFVLIPIVGAILVIVWFAGRSKPEGQRFDR